MYPFAYRRPTTLAEARAMFANGEDAAFLSGGHTLLPTMKQRLASPSDLVDLTGIAELSGIEEVPGGILVRGATTHATVAASPIIGALIPALAGLAGSIADRHVRHRGTIGGSVANNDPAADYPAAVLAMNAVVITDRRRIAADDYFTGLYETAREPDEIVTGVLFARSRSAGYAKFRNPASRYALAGVMVARVDDRVRVAVTGAYSTGVTRVTAFEEALDADFRAGALDALVVDPALLLSDPAADAEYRANLIKVLARRAVDGQGEVRIYK
ncbi:xanthine dehydrogenase family protein subunit M [Sphingomonas oligophenolica]|uniref:Xanthine dehydrogenase family protein subunit M n=2 Tax=Sphingomonas oligophenolica TaxID=301154 RepID=A0A502C5J9_9SPHN|nr:xanthine dehydrogenase family protein subunit M [Sphingomonas oligophenolica]